MWIGKDSAVCWGFNFSSCQTTAALLSGTVNSYKIAQFHASIISQRVLKFVFFFVTSRPFDHPSLEVHPFQLSQSHPETTEKDSLLNNKFTRNMDWYRIFANLQVLLVNQEARGVPYFLFLPKSSHHPVKVALECVLLAADYLCAYQLTSFSW